MNRHEQQTGAKRMTHNTKPSLCAELGLIVAAFVLVASAWLGLKAVFPDAAPYINTLLIGAGLGALSLLVATGASGWLPRRKPTEEDA